MMASAGLLRAYLDWQAEMGTEEVILPHPLERKRPAAAGSGSGFPDRPAGAHALDAVPEAAHSRPPAIPGSGSPFPDSLASETAPAGLFQSLSQALEKASDPRREEAAAALSTRAPAGRAPDASSFPAFTGLADFYAYLEIRPELLLGESGPPGSGVPAQARLLRGMGPEAAPLAVIGFEPGEGDAAEGKPFQGEPGALLEKMMRAIRMDLRELFLSNLVKVRVAGKAWSRRELARILPLLHLELGLARVPKVLLLGQECAQAVLKTGKTLDELRQETHRAENREFFVTYHPLELLRKEELKRKAWEDLQWLQRRMAEAQAGI